MDELKLYFLGPPRIELDLTPLQLRRRRSMAMLAYIAVSGEPQMRDTLATLFWAEHDHSHARTALRRDLSTLNRALGNRWLEHDGETVGLRDGVWLDAATFQQRLDAVAASHTRNLTLLLNALELVRGDFLAGFTLTDSAGFDEWQRGQREYFHNAHISCLAQITETLSNQGEPAGALGYAQRWLEADPLDEAAHRSMMQLYTTTGQHTAALRQFETCRQVLADELDVSPSPETISLHEQIRAHQSPTLESPTSTFRSARRGSNNLPTQTTAFIGRAEEVAEIQRVLLDEPACRLLNLVGPGGIGKTRLALAAAAQMIGDFADGVYFVSLAPISEAEYIVPAIAEALRFNFHGTRDPRDQLLDYLSRREMLLVIDSFEHLLAEAELLAEIVVHAQQVQLLATSRERLNLREEWCFDVQGLSYPTNDDAVAHALLDAGQPDKSSRAIESYGAVELFLQRARQVVATFDPSTDELADIQRICQSVEGMPLGIELAAPWIRILGCHEIAAEIEHSLDILSTSLHNMPARHRSLKVVFDQTWQRLPAGEQAVLRKLSVFRGGCTRVAAEHVAGATLETMTALVDKALIRRTSTGRYEIHGLIRQYADTQLQTDPREVEQTQARHADFFVRFLESHAAGVKGGQQRESLAEIQADIDNVRLAWRWCIANRDSTAVDRAAECLFIYYLYGNGYDEGYTEFGRALSAFANFTDIPVDSRWPQAMNVSNENKILVCYLLAAHGYCLAHRRDLQAGHILLEKALAMLRQSGVPPTATYRHTEAFVLLWLGWALYFQGQFTEGERYARESLAWFTETLDHFGEGRGLLLLGACIRDRRPAEADQVYSRGLLISQESGDQGVVSYFSYSLGNVAKELGLYAKSQRYIDQGLRISEEIQNMLGIGYALFCRGQLEIALGKYEQAIHTLERSVTLFSEVGTVHASRASCFLGRAFHLKGDHYQAAHVYAQTLVAYQNAGSQLGIAHCYTGLGCLELDQGNLYQAEEYFREALAVWQEMAMDAGIASTLHHLGQVRLASSNPQYAKAAQYLQQALELALKQQVAPIALDVCVEIARLYHLENKLFEAMELVSLAEQHEASTYDTRERARAVLRAMQAQLPVRSDSTAKDRAGERDLWTIVQELVTQLGSGEPRTHTLGAGPNR